MRAKSVNCKTQILVEKNKIWPWQAPRHTVVGNTGGQSDQDMLLTFREHDNVVNAAMFTYPDEFILCFLQSFFI